MGHLGWGDVAELAGTRLHIVSEGGVKAPTASKILRASFAWEAGTGRRKFDSSREIKGFVARGPVDWRDRKERRRDGACTCIFQTLLLLELPSEHTDIDCWQEEMPHRLFCFSVALEPVF